MVTTPIPPLDFLRNSYTVLEDLVNDMAMHWDEGKELLFSGTLRYHIRKVAPSLASVCTSAEKSFADAPDRASHIFLKWLCRFPGIRVLCWEGTNYGGLASIASALENPDAKFTKLIFHLLDNRLFGDFVQNCGGKPQIVEHVKFLESFFNRKNSHFSRNNAIPMLAVFLKEKMDFAFDGQLLHTPAELSNHLQRYADRSKCELSRAIQPLFQNDYNFDPYFEAWIIMHGFQHELTLWKGRFQEE